ncbi:MAG: lysine transporter LysE [Burkholderiales bacterium PBB3]|nr:MAG: lysine transporter LysE [Burkholderiales bacterium PBB3]
MNPETLGAFCLFVVASSITPGPNNTMLMASGVNFGFRSSLWHLAGVQVGFTVMLLSVGLGLQSVLQQFPQLFDVLRYAGGSYLLWMAYKLATAQPTTSNAPTAARPMGFWAAVAFQALNPKAWVMAVTCMSTYLAPQAGLGKLLTLVGLFFLLGAPSSFLWLGFGQALRQWLQDPVRLRTFNITMALALVVSLYPLLMG